MGHAHPLASCECIDVHTHVVPDSLPDSVAGHADIPWPSIRHRDACHAQVIISGKVYREIDHACWDMDRRVADIGAMGVAAQVLSPMPELLSYWLPAAPAQVLARYMNDRIAAMVARAPRRFVGLGMVPLQDIDLAVAELEYAVQAAGLRGVEIGTNVNGVPIGDTRFAPFFAAAEALGAAIFVHPLRPIGMDRLLGPPALEQVLAFPCETGLAIASLVTGGTLKRYPGVRLAFSHGGGTFAQMLPRLQHAWSMMPALQQVTDSPMSAARSLFYDTLVYSELALRFLIDSFGMSQLMIGTDHPFAIMEKAPVSRIDRLQLAAADRAALLAGNARRFLGLG